MAKKLNLDSTIENISSKVDIIMRNRLIIAIFLIVDGITFIINPNGSLAEMARSIIILVLLAAFSTLITNISSKTKDIKTIIISILTLVIGIITYIYPDLVSAYIQLILSLFIIYNGVTNIFNTLNLNKISKDNIIKDEHNKDIKKKQMNEDFKEVNKSFDEGLEQQKAKLLNPLKNIINKTSELSTLYIITNIASIILGIILLIFPDVSMMVWGIIFLYTGTSDLLVTMRTMNISKKIKEKKFKEIIYDMDKTDKQVNNTNMG